MIRIYGSSLCPDCVSLKKNCEQYGIAFAFRDITASLGFMKEFLKLRDESEEFDAARKDGNIGIPAVITEKGNLTLDWKKVITDAGYEPFEETHQACSLSDRSGC